jgi:ATP-dependent protease ClpP protease subunit
MKKYTTKTIPSFKNSDEDEEPSYQGKQLEFQVRTKAQHQFSVDIDEPFIEPSYYRNVIRMLQNAAEDDIVVFYINSPGGALSSLQSLLEALKSCDATTVAVLVGQAASAASIFSLHCDFVEVTDSAHMLCHYISYGTGGKGADVLAHVNHTTKISNKLMQDTYKDFLSPSEINELIEGREIYLDCDDIRARLQKKADAVAAKDAEPEEVPVEAPKAKRKAKKPKESSVESTTTE